ncbi:MAG: hydroxymethylglutaryl-CoA lyase [Alphaproteobacteria bacterium]|jgi:hydroxymethylglutaryl-CoA lyase|nr:hydroxymethylglutaryl-CoA lyase [Alphaproteobacteria bacterium]
MSKSLISIVEVGPRDGLQNESQILSVERRVQLIDLLSPCGFAEIEVGSFVSPKWIPQMADTDLVFRQIHQDPKTRYSTLVPNERGMTDAIAAGVQNVSIFTAASEAFSQKNTNCSIEESYERFVPVMDMAKDQGIRVRGYVSCAITCPYEGDIAPHAVARVAQRLMDLGCAEISLGDTIGKGTPETIAAMVEAVAQGVPVERLAIHCHDTYGNAVNNVLEALRCGIRVVDAAIHGLGGCPYATTKQGEKAKGNVATEGIVAALEEKGYQTTIDQGALRKASEFVGLIVKGMA